MLVRLVLRGLFSAQYHDVTITTITDARLEWFMKACWFFWLITVFNRAANNHPAVAAGNAANTAVAKITGLMHAKIAVKHR